MAGRYLPLATGEYYHVYNRGVARQPIFLSKGDYEQMLLTLTYYRFRKPPVRLSRFKELSKDNQKNFLVELENKNEKLVEFISFVLIPNHFHLLLRQETENGISTFTSKAINSYTKYFNTKRERVGAILQGVFKAVHVGSSEQLVHLSRYIHLNPLVSFVVREKNFLSYPWSSLPDYLRGKSSLFDLEPVLGEFKSPGKYKEFILDQKDYARRLDEIKHLMLEKG
ncbi:transposase [Candidatus Gottesmanbacteria bacterium]|nr:transposase [Candidatus Gottesmanbacteria bacterium]